MHKSTAATNSLFSCNDASTALKQRNLEEKNKYIKHDIPEK